MIQIPRDVLFGVHDTNVLAVLGALVKTVNQLVEEIEAIKQQFGQNATKEVMPPTQPPEQA